MPKIGYREGPLDERFGYFLDNAPRKRYKVRQIQKLLGVDAGSPSARRLTQLIKDASGYEMLKKVEGLRTAYDLMPHETPAIEAEALCNQEPAVAAEVVLPVLLQEVEEMTPEVMTREQVLAEMDQREKDLASVDGAMSAYAEQDLKDYERPLDLDAAREAREDAQRSSPERRTEVFKQWLNNIIGIINGRRFQGRADGMYVTTYSSTLGHGLASKIDPDEIKFELLNLETCHLIDIDRKNDQIAWAYGLEIILSAHEATALLIHKCTTRPPKAHKRSGTPRHPIPRVA